MGAQVSAVGERGEGAAGVPGAVDRKRLQGEPWQRAGGGRAGGQRLAHTCGRGLGRAVEGAVGLLEELLLRRVVLGLAEVEPLLAPLLRPEEELALCLRKLEQHHVAVLALRQVAQRRVALEDDQVVLGLRRRALLPDQVHQPVL